MVSRFDRTDISPLISENDPQISYHSIPFLCHCLSRGMGSRFADPTCKWSMKYGR